MVVFFAGDQFHYRRAAPAPLCLQADPENPGRAAAADCRRASERGKIKQQLAEAEQRHAEILAKANAVAQK